MLMLGFGLGTLPAMLLAGNVFNYFKGWAKSPWIRTSAGLMIIAFGLYSGLSVLKPYHHHTGLSSTVLVCGCDPLVRVPAILRSLS